MSSISFLGKDSQKLDFSCEKQNKKIFITETKFHRDWIKREYGDKIIETLGDFDIVAKEEHKDILNM